MLFIYAYNCSTICIGKYKLIRISRIAPQSMHVYVRMQTKRWAVVLVTIYKWIVKKSGKESMALSVLCVAAYKYSMVKTVYSLPIVYNIEFRICTMYIYILYLFKLSIDANDDLSQVYIHGHRTQITHITHSYLYFISVHHSAQKVNKYCSGFLFGSVNMSWMMTKL